VPFLTIVLLCVASAIVYGIVHDQVTARVCVEYFTIGHPPVFLTESPTLLALGWGTIATWWCGLILGLPLALIARSGPRPKLTVRDLVKPVAVLLACMGLLASIAGAGGYLAARASWVWLVAPLASLVPEEKHVLFLADLWAHLAAYATGFLGGTVVWLWAWRERRRRG
jgi:hypothetical protein